MSVDQLTGVAAEQLVAGIRVTAPGLTGSAESLGRDITSKLLTPGSQLIHSTLENSGLYATEHIAITHTASATDEVTFTFPAPRAGYNCLLLIHDSTGALSWHMSDDVAARTPSDKVQPAPSSDSVSANDAPGSGSSTDASRTGGADADASAARTVSFTVPARRFAADVEHVSRWAHLVGLVEHFFFHPSLAGARKLLSVVEYPIEHLVGKLGSEWFAEWENNKHPNVIRWFPPEGDLSVGEPLSPTNWHQLAEGPTLLFIHGIFSSCESGFSGISHDDTTWPALRERYEGRIIGFDHPTASVSPTENARWFLSQIPTVKLDLDIVCHSRGGLVARSLAEQAVDWGNGPGQSLTIGRIVFAATPNGGSQITEPGKWEALVNRISSVLTLPAKVLPAPADVIGGILAGLLEVIKIVGVGVALDLPGLEDMSPGSQFLTDLARAATSPPPSYFAAAADFEPGPILANLFDRLDDLGRVVDTEIFGKGVSNDIAVPTEGVWNPASVPVPAVLPSSENPPVPGVDPPPHTTIPGFPIIDQTRRLNIGPGSRYWHCDYFDDSAMRSALLDWLSERPKVDR